MTQTDLLPQIPSSLPVLIVDRLLYWLTHPHSIKRRTSWVIVFLVIPTLVYSILSIHHHKEEQEEEHRVVEYSRDHDDLSLDLDSIEPGSISTSYYSNSLPISVILVNPTSSKVNKLEFQIKWLSKLDPSGEILKEVIVWNDDVSIDFTRKDLNLTSHSYTSLKIFNSPSRFDSLSSHYACSLLTSPSIKHCYIINDLETFNPFFKTMYHHYLDTYSLGNLFGIQQQQHSSSSLRWWWERIVINQELNSSILPLSSSQLSSYFIPKKLSTKFLSQLLNLNQFSIHPHLGEFGRKEILKFGGDLLFTIWLNSIPEIWTVIIRDDDRMISTLNSQQQQQQRKLVEERRARRREEEDEFISRSIKILSLSHHHHHHLHQQHEHDHYSLSLSEFQSHAKSPCWNDECIFLTSIPSFPIPPSSPSSFFSSSSSLESAEEGTLPYLAVDSNPKTCFKPIHHRELNIGDYYGLEFIQSGGGRELIKIELVGSEILGGIVSWDREDEVLETQGKMGWVVMTERKNGGGGWEPRQLVNDSITIRLPSSSSSSSSSKEEGVGGGLELFKTFFELIPITTPTTFTDDPSRGTYELKEDGVVRIGKIKLVRIGSKKKQKQEKEEEEEQFYLCGWNLDGWEL
ncbi:hypothetical protein JCM3765_001244 [Sporobolomyces pararoseus]